MLQRLMRDLKGDAIAATDGDIGSVKDAYFDDERWAVRYLVVDTGKWLPGERVLISPAAVAESRRDALNVRLSREQVEGAPRPDKDPPISRLMEQAHAQYYGYPYYWAGPYLWGYAAMPVSMPVAEHEREATEAQKEAEARARESHLRSSAEVVGYRIEAVDGELGHVEDFVYDDRTWAIEYLVVDTRNWRPGGNVLVPPDAVRDVDWEHRTVTVGLTRDELAAAPKAH